MEIITMMDVKVPSANVWNAHIMTAQFGRLDLPQDVGTGGVLVTNLDCCRSHTVNTLPKGNYMIQSVRHLEIKTNFS